MQPLSSELLAAYGHQLDRAQVPTAERADYHKWVRFYLDFCDKYGHGPALPTSLGPFLTKLAQKNQTVAQRRQAAAAVRLLTQPALGGQHDFQFHLPSPDPGVTPPLQAAPLARVPPPQPVRHPPHQLPVQAATGNRSTLPSATEDGQPVTDPSPPARLPGRGSSWEKEYRELEGAIRMRNYSPRTLESYRFWVAKFQGFVHSRPAAELGSQEVRGFLSALAVCQGVAASTQNQAFNALLFFYRHVLGREFGHLDGVVRAKRHRYVPVVLSRAEVEALLAQLPPPYRLVGLLLYGCGLRLAECVNLRVQCFNLEASLLTVHDGKGQKDRTVPLPTRALPHIQEQLEHVRRLHAQDLAADYAGVFLPRQLEKKYPSAAREFIWQWFFPAPTLTWLPQLRQQRRYHLHENYVQGAIKQAAARAGIPKRVSPHVLRHTYASHLLLAHYDLQTIQRLLGHSDIKTTLIYLQTVPATTLKEAKSPLDAL